MLKLDENIKILFGYLASIHSTVSLGTHFYYIIILFEFNHKFIIRNRLNVKVYKQISSFFYGNVLHLIFKNASLF